MPLMSRRSILAITLPAALLAFQSALPVNSTAAIAAEPQYIEMSIGNPDAEVTVIEYLSFTCPHCASFHTGPFKSIKANYIDTGKINFIFREVYFDRPGLWAGMTARCGGAEKYFGVADMLLKRQSSWSRLESAAEIVQRLHSIGTAGGLERAELDNCLQDEANAKLLVESSLEQRDGDGISSTPSFVINGKRHGNMGYEEFSGILDDLLGG